MNRPINRDEIGHLLNPTRGKFSWLNTRNRKAILKAYDTDKDTVKLEGLTWSDFSIRLSKDHNKIFVSPYGRNAPFSPSVWLDMKKLRHELEEIAKYEREFGREVNL